eukprot:1260882-Pleurochrysis_carterae.AAC.3
MREMCEIRASCCRLPLLACHAHGSSAASVLVALAERAFFFRLHGQAGACGALETMLERRLARSHHPSASAWSLRVLCSTVPARLSPSSNCS